MLKRIIACLLCLTAALPLAACEKDPLPPIETSGDMDTETDPGAVTDTWAILQEELRKTIDENLAILLPDGNVQGLEKDWIAANPEAFDTIVSCGESALPYLTELADGFEFYDNSAENCRRALAKYAAYTIHPSLYDLVYPSPDGTYSAAFSPTSFACGLDPFMGTQYSLTVSDTQNNAVLLSAEELCFAAGVTVSADAPLLQWSPDGNYALFMQGYRHTITRLYIADIQNAVCYALPHKAELEAVLQKNLAYYDTETDAVFDNLHLSLGTWGDGTVTVKMSLSHAVGGSADIGEYTYDLVNGSITDITVTAALAPVPAYQSFYTETDGYGVSAHTGAAGMQFHYFYTTADAGKTWTDMETNLDTVYPCVITGISFRDESVGFVVYRYWDDSFSPPIVMTTDGGKTWKKQMNICDLLQEYADQHYMLQANPPQFHEDGRCTIEIKGTLPDNPTDCVYVTIESTDCETWKISHAETEPAESDSAK